MSVVARWRLGLVSVREGQSCWRLDLNRLVEFSTSNLQGQETGPGSSEADQDPINRIGRHPIHQGGAGQDRQSAARGWKQSRCSRRGTFILSTGARNKPTARPFDGPIRATRAAQVSCADVSRRASFRRDFAPGLDRIYILPRRRMRVLTWAGARPSRNRR